MNCPYCNQLCQQSNLTYHCSSEELHSFWYYTQEKRFFLRERRKNQELEIGTDFLGTYLTVNDTFLDLNIPPFPPEDCYLKLKQIMQLKSFL